MKSRGDILLLSCYELGHQPLGVAWPQAFLEEAGYRPTVQDLAVERLDPEQVRRASLVGISVPMHTALRLGVRAAARVRELNPAVRIAFFGLYASLNAKTLLESAADFVIGGEYERALVGLAHALASGQPNDVPGVSDRSRVVGPVLGRLRFPPARRSGLPSLDRYAKLVVDGEQRSAGYVEASRGCKHLCRHCPIPPVYEGAFFPIPVEAVLQDIAGLVTAGAGHVTFGDPDFLNGPAHARRVVNAMHERFPNLTFDFTAKIEHLLTHRALLPEFAKRGGLFVVSAVESFSDVVLERLAKGHSKAGALEAFRVVRDAGLVVRPSLVPFTPWSTLEDYIELLEIAAREDLIDCVDPVQYTIRLLVPPGSLLQRDPAMTPYLGGLDASSFSYRWAHPDPRMDRLYRDVLRLVEDATGRDEEPVTTFLRVSAVARAAQNGTVPESVSNGPVPSHRRAPRLTEPWFCCAEPTNDQLRSAF